MTKRDRPTRRSGVRDPKIIIIAAEGTQTEKHYFEGLAHWYHNSKIKVKIIERANHNSDPQHVLDSLEEFCDSSKINETDEKWLVIDVDRWETGTLSLIAQLVLQKQISLAVSNPCFEIWLLLHVADVANYPVNTIIEFKNNSKDRTSRTRLERELIYLLGRYNKSKPELSDFLPHLEDAINRSRSLDTNPADRWPNDIGTRVYLLAQNIISS